MTIVPRLRVNRSRSPFAAAAITSAPAEPLKRSVSASAPPSTTSLPSPGSQHEGVDPRVERGRVVAGVAVGGVGARAADELVGPVAAGERVVAVAAVERQGDQRGRGRAASGASPAAEPVDPQAIGRGLGAGDGDGNGQPVTCTAPADAGRLDRVRGGRAVEGHDVRGAVGAEVDAGDGDARAGEVAEGDAVRAAARDERERLQARAVDRCGTAARQREAPGARRRGERVARGRCLDARRVGAGAAVDNVGTGPDARDEGVVAGTAPQRVGTVAAGDLVVAVAAVERHAHERRQGAGRQRVVAAEAGDRQPVEGRLRAGDGDPRDSSPVTSKPPVAGAARIVSPADPALIVTVSAAPSAAPRTPRSRSTALTPAGPRSSAVTASAPPRVSSTRRSTVPALAMARPPG